MAGSHLYEMFYGRESLNHKLFMLINHTGMPLLDAVMPVVTMLGGSKVFPLYFALLLALHLIDRKVMPVRYLAVYLVATILSVGAESFLKELFHVPRPPFAMGAGSVRLLGRVGNTFSLPSGHAVFSFMTACVLARGRGAWCRFLLFSSALLVAYSRVYLGVHYPLDVAVGALVGAGCGVAAWKLCGLAQVWYGQLRGKGRGR